MSDARAAPYLVDVELALASGQFPVAGGELANEVVTVNLNSVRQNKVKRGDSSSHGDGQRWAYSTATNKQNGARQFGSGTSDNQMMVKQTAFSELFFSSGVTRRKKFPCKSNKRTARLLRCPILDKCRLKLCSSQCHELGGSGDTSGPTDRA